MCPDIYRYYCYVPQRSTAIARGKIDWRICPDFAEYIKERPIKLDSNIGMPDVT
jgi:hypothetical protein